MDGRALTAAEQVALLDEMADIIQASHLFKSLDTDGRTEVLESGYVMTFHENDVVIKQGDVGEVMYLILRGKVAVETATPGGTVQLAELGHGACVGEVSVLSGQMRTATVTALEDVDAVAFHKHRIERVLEKFPRVREILESIVDARARDTIEKIIG